jgi:Fic family protein
MVAYHHKWKPIEDLPTEFSWRGPDIDALRKAWVRYREKLKGSSALEEFYEKLNRRWSIETGIIERIYSIDRGTTEILVEHGLKVDLIEHGTTDLPKEEIIQILRAHRDALDGLFDFIKGERPLTISYIKELHQALLRHQSTVRVKDANGNSFDKPLIKGAWKKLPNNPARPDGSVHEYCPPEQVQSEMERLVDLHNSHVSNDPVEEAAWLHHRFTQIHPFEDGNGRVARALASLTLIKGNGFPLVVNRDQRAEYIETLETADDGNLIPLIKLISLNQDKLFQRALSVPSDLLLPEPSEIIDAAIAKLHESNQMTPAFLKSLDEQVGQVEVTVRQELGKVVSGLHQRLKLINPNFDANVRIGGFKRRGWQVDTFDSWAGLEKMAAQKIGIAVNSSVYRNYIELEIVEKRLSQIHFLLSGLGSEFNGLLVITGTMMIKERERDSNYFTKLLSTDVVTPDPFVFSLDTPINQVVEELRNWLKPVIITVLSEWQRQI